MVKNWEKKIKKIKIGFRNIFWGLRPHTPGKSRSLDTNPSSELVKSCLKPQKRPNYEDGNISYDMMCYDIKWYDIVS